MRSINWSEVIAGFCLGLLPLLTRQVYILWRYSRLPSRKKFLGTFWQYHRSTSGHGQIYEGRYVIRYSLLTARLIVKGDEALDSGGSQSHIRYHGSISKREGMVRYFTLKDSASHEQMSWCLVDPFHDPFEKTLGLYLSLDIQGLPAAGGMILSRRRLSSEWVESHIDDHVLRVRALVGEETIGESLVIPSRTRAGFAHAPGSTPDSDPGFDSVANAADDGSTEPRH